MYIIAWEQDHPRRCGENSGDNPTKTRHLGSPPQVRGKLRQHSTAAKIVRITPAGAGKTAAQPPFQFRCRDHPRRCGENSSARYCPCFRAGSPPQVRGKQRILDQLCADKRITPAGAGKTLFAGIPRNQGQDHPRRCGENVSHSNTDSRKPGSPPQVRGKRLSILSASISLRITPAGAGKTSIGF